MRRKVKKRERTEEERRIKIRESLLFTPSRNILKT